MKENKIYIKDWLELKPYDKQAPTDSYYMHLSNRVLEAVIQFRHNLPSLGLNHLTKNLASFITSYFEDQVSNAGLWNTFVKLHKRYYNKPIPFYELDDYYEDEINVQDVQFLLWYFFNSSHKEQFIRPHDPLFLELAESIMDVLDEAWEYAPENEELQRYYRLDEQETDYYKARALMDTILFKSYLFYPDTAIELIENEVEIFEEFENEFDEGTYEGPHPVLSVQYESRDTMCLETRTNLLSLQGKEWAAELLGQDHPLYESFLNLSEKITAMFTYAGEDAATIHLTHIGTDRIFKITKKSLHAPDDLKVPNSMLFMGIAKWRSEWRFSGIFTVTEYDADYKAELEEEDRNQQTRVYALEKDDKLVYQSLQKQQKTFEKLTKGELITFLQVQHVKAFLDEFKRLYNGPANKSKQEAPAELPLQDDTQDIDDIIHDYEPETPALLFFNPDKGPELVAEMNSAFPLPNNPFFNEEESTDDLMQLLMSEAASANLVKYCIDRCKNQLPFFNTDEGKLVLNNLDFLLRFWKVDSYYSQMATTLGV